MPGQRDRHAGCVGAHLVENDLFDFLLFSLPDNDTYSHRVGPGEPAGVDRRGRPRARAADGRRRRRRRVPGRARGDRDVRPLAEPDRVERRTWPRRSPTGASCCPPTPSPTRPRWRCARARARRRSTCSTRSAATSSRREVAERAARTSRAWTWCCAATATRAWCGASAASCASRPGGDLTDTRGGAWSVEGDHAALDLTCTDGVVRSHDYPRRARPPVVGARLPARRRRAACRPSPAHEFIDWGGHDHVGGGSHGSLHRCDSLGVLLMCGIGPAAADARAVVDRGRDAAGARPLRGGRARRSERA